MYASSVAFVRRVDHSSFILSCNLIGQRENKSRYVTEIVLPLGYADVIFRRRESRQPEIRLRSQATPDRSKMISLQDSDDVPVDLFLLPLVAFLFLPLLVTSIDFVFCRLQIFFFSNAVGDATCRQTNADGSAVGHSISRRKKPGLQHRV